MIEITTLIDDDRGRRVIYRPKRGQQEERGRIKGWSAHLIYVVYRCSDHWDQFEYYAAFPTPPENFDYECPDSEPQRMSLECLESKVLLAQPAQEATA